MMLMAMLLSGITVALEDESITDSGASAGAGYTLTNDGKIEAFRLNADPDTEELGEWIRPASFAPGDYKVKATLQSGSLDAGTVDAWLALTSDRSWAVTDGGATLLIQISIDETTIIASATITLTATAA